MGYISEAKIGVALEHQGGFPGTFANNALLVLPFMLHLFYQHLHQVLKLPPKKTNSGHWSLQKTQPKHNGTLLWGNLPGNPSNIRHIKTYIKGIILPSLGVPEAHIPCK